MSETKVIQNHAKVVHVHLEPTIKVSELREWCEAKLKEPDNHNDLTYPSEAISYYYKAAFKDILTKFCGGK